MLWRYLLYVSRDIRCTSSAVHYGVKGLGKVGQGKKGTDSSLVLVVVGSSSGGLQWDAVGQGAGDKGPWARV